MSRRAWGIVILIVLSEVFGLLAANWFFGLYDRTVPPAMVTAFNRSTAHGAFLFQGLILGLIIAIWSLAVLLLATFFRPRKDPGA